MARNKTEQVKRELMRDRAKPEAPLRIQDSLSSGSTLFNLALTGKARGAFFPGKYYFFVGASDSGKTWLTLTSFAEATINPKFKDYRLIHDNAEDGALMDLSAFFGSSVAQRIEPPRGTREDPEVSATIEDFYFNIDDALRDGRPFIYVLDSMDALDAKQDQKKFAEQKKAARRPKPGEKEPAGSYGMAKAKMNSAGLRTVFSKLKKTNSILIIICQERDNPAMFSFDDKTHAGGRALKFYCHAQIWTSIAKTMVKKVKDKNRDLGIVALVKVKKNRQTGRKAAVKVPIYWSVGLDDVGGCVDYLVEEGHWSKGSGGINAKEFDVCLHREDLVKHIEVAELEPELQSLVQDVWDEIKDACTPERKRKYGGESEG